MMNKNKWGQWIATTALIVTLFGCNNAPSEQGQQYKDGDLNVDLTRVEQPNVDKTPSNVSDYLQQIREIKEVSPSLFSEQSANYLAILNWIEQGADPKKLTALGLSPAQMAGTDNKGNVLFTGYYTPVLHARKEAQGEFQFPLYSKPDIQGEMPTRKQIYNGILGKRYILGYSASLMDNFVMEVQGSGYVDFGDNEPQMFFGFGGKNGQPYRSIGKILVRNGDISASEISMQAIHQWAKKRSDDQVRELLEQNQSFVFFKPEPYTKVRGASGVPLVAKTAVASDRRLIPAGSTLLAEVPQLDKQGKFNGKFDLRLMVALDVGGAIQGHHFDIYQGHGSDAEQLAGYYNHFGRVWLLNTAN